MMTVSIEELQAIVDMPNDIPHIWHSIRLERLQAICRLAIEQKKMLNSVEIARSIPKPGPFIAKRAGYDFPCALHSGPMGECNKENCRCQ
jgi:hypothetical protein